MIILGPKKSNRVDEEKMSSSNAATDVNRVTPGKLRLSKDISQLDLPNNAIIKFPKKEDITKFEVTVKPEEGSYWYGGTYSFTVTVSDDYPQEPPKITCNTKVIL